jgi:hypothetical protein
MNVKDLLINQQPTVPRVESKGRPTQGESRKSHNEGNPKEKWGALT